MGIRNLGAFALVAIMNAAPIELPNHGGAVTVRTGAGFSAHAYQYETLPAVEGERRFRLLITPALPVSFVEQHEVRLGGTEDGTFEIEVTENDGFGLALVPGDPELQGEVARGAVPNETRLTLVTVAIAPGYEGRTSVVTFETVPQ